MNSAEDRQPRPQGAFPWLCMRWAREKRPGDEVGRSDKRCRSFSTRERAAAFRLACLEIRSRNEETINATRNMIYSLKVFYFLIHLPASRRLLFPLLHAEKGPFSACNKENRRRLQAGNTSSTSILFICF